MTKNEIINPDNTITYELTPDENKCFKSKATGHKFIHTNGKQGLPLYVSEEEISLYEEIDINGN